MNRLQQTQQLSSNKCSHAMARLHIPSLTIGSQILEMCKGTTSGIVNLATAPAQADVRRCIPPTYANSIARLRRRCHGDCVAARLLR